MFGFGNKCQRVQRLLSDQVDASLSTGAKRTVENHLAGCSECRDALAFFEELKNTASSLEDLAPPAYLWERISIRLDEDPWGEDELLRQSVDKKRISFLPLKGVMDLTGAIACFALIVFLCLLPGLASDNSAISYHDSVRAEEYNPDVEYLSLYMMTHKERFPREVRDYYLNLLTGLNQTIKKIKTTLDRFPQNRHIQSQLAIAYEKKIELYQKMGYSGGGGRRGMAFKVFGTDISGSVSYE